jgi:neutral ceramidase
MRVGTAWEDITPDKPVPLLGQMAIRLGEYKHDPLTANAVVFDDGQTKTAVVSVDVCFMPSDLVRRLQAACAAPGNIDAESVIIAATHTHVAPCTTDRLFGATDPEFMARLSEGIASAVNRAIDDLEEVDLFAGTGYIENMGWNRRGLRSDGACHMYHGSWQEGHVGIEGPRDGGVGVVFARDADGAVKVVIPSFSTHPNTLEGESFYSADIPGEIRRVLRGVLGNDIGVVYLTGAAGNTAPSIMVDNPTNEQPWRGESGLARSGQYLGGEILRVIAEQTEAMDAPVLRHEAEFVDIPMRPWDEGVDISEFGGGMFEFFKKSRDEWDSTIAEESPVEVRLNALRIGDAAICFNPAELYSEFGLAIKERSPARVTLVSELSDGGVGYVPTPQAIKHGGYSAQASDVAKLAPDAGWTIVGTTEKLLGRAFGEAT